MLHLQILVQFILLLDLNQLFIMLMIYFVIVIIKFIVIII